MNRLKVRAREIMVRFYARERYVSRLQIAKTGSGFHPFDRYKKLFLLGAKSLENEAVCFPPCSAMVENHLSYTSTSKHAFSSFPLVVYIKRKKSQQSVLVSCRRKKIFIVNVIPTWICVLFRVKNSVELSRYWEAESRLANVIWSLSVFWNVKSINITY